MARKIQFKRGLEANLPQLDVAEFGFTTDSKKPFIGSATGNVELSKKVDVDALKADVTQHAYKSDRVFNLDGYQTDSDVTGVILQKISEGYTTFLVPHDIVLNTPLIIKNNTVGSLVFRGIGTERFTTPRTKSNFLLNTGGIGIKLVNCEGVTFENLILTTLEQTNKSTIALMETRELLEDGITTGYAHGTCLKNVSIRMEALSGTGSIGLYNDTAEGCNYHNLTIRADRPAILTSCDLLNIASNPYTGSLMGTCFSGLTEFISYSGKPALICDSISGLVIEQTYIGDLNNMGVNTDNNTFGIKFIGYNSNISVNVSSEHYNSVFGIHGRVSTFDLKSNEYRAFRCIKIAQDAAYPSKTSPTQAPLLKNGTVRNEGASAYDIYVAPRVDLSKGGTALDTVQYLGKCRIFNDGTVAKLLSSGGETYTAGVTDFQSMSSVTYGQDEILLNPSSNRGVGTCFSTPSAGQLFVNGMYYLRKGITKGMHGIISKDSSANTVTGAQMGYQERAGTPVGFLTPVQMMEFAFDNSAKHWYMSVGLTNADWKQITV